MAVEVVSVVTEGDQRDEPLPAIGGRGLFTAALEEALRAGRVDCAVHSLKDLPTTLPEDMEVVAVLRRADAADALVTERGVGLEELPSGCRVGTSSPRRAALIRYFRPDLTVLPLRGNLDTRLSRLGREIDAIVVAAAGLRRLGRHDVPHVVLDPTRFVPAPGQGALAVEARRDLEPAIRRLLIDLDHRPTRQSTDEERGFLAALGGGCAAPVGAYAEVDEAGTITLQVVVEAVGGGLQFLRSEGSTGVGPALARRLLAEGVDRAP